MLFSQHHATILTESAHIFKQWEDRMPHNSFFHRSQMILNIINHLGPISRTELIDLTDWRPASVGDIIKELLEKQLIIETGHSSGGHGR